MAMFIIVSQSSPLLGFQAKLNLSFYHSCFKFIYEL